MMKKIDIRFGVLIAIIVVAALSRLLTHGMNIAPLGAIALFGAAYFTKKWYAILIPIVAVWLSDVLINNTVYAAYFPTFTWFYEGCYWMYGSYALIAVLATVWFSKINIGKVIGGAVGASVLFFLLSNFSVWLTGTMYPKDWSGLIACYGAAIPFFKGTLFGNLFFSTLLFGSFELMKMRFPRLKLNIN